MFSRLQPDCININRVENNHRNTWTQAVDLSDNSKIHKSCQRVIKMEQQHKSTIAAANEHRQNTKSLCNAVVVDAISCADDLPYAKKIYIICILWVSSIYISVLLLRPSSSYLMTEYNREVVCPSLSLVTLSSMSCYLSLWTPPPWKIFTDAFHFYSRFPTDLCKPYISQCWFSILVASNKLGQTHLPLFSALWQNLSIPFPIYSPSLHHRYI